MDDAVVEDVTLTKKVKKPEPSADDSFVSKFITASKKFSHINIATQHIGVYMGKK